MMCRAHPRVEDCEARAPACDRAKGAVSGEDAEQGRRGREGAEG